MNEVDGADNQLGEGACKYRRARGSGHVEGREGLFGLTVGKLRLETNPGAWRLGLEGFVVNPEVLATSPRTAKTKVDRATVVKNARASPFVEGAGRNAGRIPVDLPEACKVAKPSDTIDPVDVDSPGMVVQGDVNP
ncbi:MAG: hypothetical protein WCK05_11975 [Planctomycetota bacterium]